MPRRLKELDESARKAAAKSADSRSSNFTGVEWDNDTVSKFFLIRLSILTDVAPGHTVSAGGSTTTIGGAAAHDLFLPSPPNTDTHDLPLFAFTPEYRHTHDLFLPSPPLPGFNPVSM
jgi:hypothetical protein